jgi:hypothetical protein
MPPFADGGDAGGAVVVVCGGIEEQLAARADIEPRRRGEVRFPAGEQGRLRIRMRILGRAGDQLQLDLVANDIDAIQVDDVIANPGAENEIDAAAGAGQVQGAVDVALADEVEHLMFAALGYGPVLPGVLLVR